MSLRRSTMEDAGRIAKNINVIRPGFEKALREKPHPMSFLHEFIRNHRNDYWEVDRGINKVINLVFKNAALEHDDVGRADISLRQKLCMATIIQLEIISKTIGITEVAIPSIAVNMATVQEMLASLHVLIDINKPAPLTLAA